MASGDQIKALVQSFISSDSERFKTIALQVAAREARSGHTRLAEEIRELLEKRKAPELKVLNLDSIASHKLKGDLGELLSLKETNVRLSHIVLHPELIKKLKRVIQEQQRLSKIKSHGLHVRRKLLLTGHPGTGKTFTASILAGELGIPLYSIRLDGLISKFLGETATKLRLIFNTIQEFRAVYFFDEFDSIGSTRYDRNDVGEMRRVLNSFLQFIEEDQSNSIIVSATNFPESLDHALFRRFDDVLEYNLPSEEQIKILIKNTLAAFNIQKPSWGLILLAATGLSHAEIVKACEESAKTMIVEDKDKISSDDLVQSLNERRNFKSMSKNGKK